MQSRAGRPAEAAARVLFADEITLPVVLRVAFQRRLKEILHTEPLGPSIGSLLGFCRRVDLVSAQVAQISYHIGQVRDATGESGAIVALRHARELCRRILQEHLVREPLVRQLG